MKPIELTMNAFGTFSGNVTVSFENLSKNSVFLITGDTGAGKTTIFDALCFALYGTSSGYTRCADSRSGDTSCFRSQYIKDDTLTYAELIFSCSDKKYRIIRNPSYLYEKKQKDGSVTIKQKKSNAVLYEISDDNTEIVICSGTVMTNNKITEITGMTNDQFRRIIMIAQGEFQKFLFAKVEEKGAILQKLFGTEPYKLIGVKLSEKRSELKKIIDSQKLNIISELKKIYPSDENDKKIYISKLEQNSLMTEKSLCDMCSMLENSGKSAGNEILTLKAEREKISSETDSLRINIEKGKIRNEKIRRYKEKSLELSGIKNKINTAEENYRKAQTYTEKISELEKEKNILSDRMDKYTILDSLKIEINSLGKKLLSTESSLSNQKILNENTENKINSINNYFDSEKYIDPRIESEKTSNDIKDKKHILEELKEKSVRTDLYRKTLAELHKIQNEYNLTYKNYFESEKPLFDNIEKNFYMSSASILAETLKNDYPCPVCGSKKHPAPAVKTSDTVSQEQYRSAKKRLEFSLQKMNSCKTKLEKQQALAEERKIDEDNTLPQKITALTKEIYTLELHFNQLQEKISDDEMKRTSLKNLCTKRLEYQEKYNRLTSELNEIQNLFTAKKSEETVISKDLSYPDRRTAQAHADALSSEINRLKTQLESSENKLRLLQNEEKSLTGLISELELEIKNMPEYDTAEGEKRYNILRENEKNISDKISILAKYCFDCESAVANVKKQSEEFLINDRKERLYGELADKINGNLKGYDRISFESFVQAYYMNSILANANLKLNILSKGRYSLHRCTEDKKHNQKAGLNIEVYDEYTGLSRNVKTLSGGETFLASLALALGLSDTVQQRSGGIKLDAMFIDEGFGSLDGEALECVIRVLEQLSDNNRMIGIISHVSELSDRFDTKLIVTKSDHGSSVKAVVQ